MRRKTKVVILGGGFGGAYAAETLGKIYGLDNVEIVLVDRNNYLLFYPLLVEAGVGSIEARHVVIPLRKFLRRGDFRMAVVVGVNLQRKSFSYQVIGSNEIVEDDYDHLVISLGSITKTGNIPGLKEHGFELKSLMDAIALRDRGIRKLELANTISDSKIRQELLTCVVVGANFTGIEFAGEYQAFLREAAKAYPNVQTDEIRMIVLEYSDRILGATTEKLAKWSWKTLTKRGVEIRVNNTLREVGPDYAITADGDRIPTHMVLWAAGIAPHPLLAAIEGLPLNQHGYIDCEPDLKVKGFNNVWAIGDLATVLAEDGKPYAATAQTASRAGAVVAQNIGATIRGGKTKPFKHKPLGSFAAIGHKQAAADVLGFSFTGFIGWVLYRATYLAKMPSLGMKLRLMADWTTELVFRNEPVQLGVHWPEAKISTDDQVESKVKRSVPVVSR